jgi:hypothetical protein
VSANYARQFAAVVLIAFVFATSATAKRRARPVSTKVRFLAESTFLRNTYGPNEDTYLAEMTIPSQQQKAVLIRLVDEYPNEAPSLARNVVASPSGASLRVLRDAECDRPYSQMLLRAAPGDLIAILPERLEYHPNLESIPAPGSILQCYRVVRR